MADFVDPATTQQINDATAKLVTQADRAEQLLDDLEASSPPAGADASWGNIVGTLSNQTDLQGELDTLQTNIDGVQSNVDLKLDDAPSDGSQYARQDGAWAVVTGGGTGDASWGSITGTLSNQTDLQAELDVKLEDAPIDTLQYARQDGDWVVVSTGVGGDMLASVYDPTGVADDAFDMDNMVEGVTAKIMTDAERTKLTGIESGATADQTGAEIKVAYEAEADTNAYTDAEKSKLGGIEAGATADQTGAEIKAAYEAELDTNAFTDSEQSKLAGIEAGAQVNTVDEAPIDGNQYARKDGDWEQVVAPEAGVSYDTGVNTANSNFLDFASIDALGVGEYTIVGGTNGPTASNSDSFNVKITYSPSYGMYKLEANQLTQSGVNIGVGRADNKYYRKVSSTQDTGWVIQGGNSTVFKTYSSLTYLTDAATITERLDNGQMRLGENYMTAVATESLPTTDNAVYIVSLMVGYSASQVFEYYTMRARLHNDPAGDSFWLRTVTDTTDTGWTEITNITSMDDMVEGATTKIMTDVERTKLAGIADGAEVNEVEEAPIDGTEYVRKDGAWATSTAGGGGGDLTWDLLGSANITTSVANVDISGWDDTLYDEYKIIFRGVSVSTTDADFRVIFFENGTPVTASTYAWCTTYANNLSPNLVPEIFNNTSDTAITIANTVRNTSTQGAGVTGEMTVYSSVAVGGNDFNPAHWQCFSYGENRVTVINGSAATLPSTNVTQLDGFRFLTNAGNLQNGRIEVFGRLIN